MDQILDKASLIEYLRSVELSELGYILGRYCGPHNVILAEKKYGNLARHLQRLVNDEIASREFDELLLITNEA